VLDPRPASGLQAKKARQRANHRLEHGNARYLELAAALAKLGTQLVVHDREQHDSRIGSDRSQHLLHLARCADQRPGMLDRIDALELDNAGARDAVDRLACRIRHEMKVKEPLFFAADITHRCANPVGEMSKTPRLIGYTILMRQP